MITVNKKKAIEMLDPDRRHCTEIKTILRNAGRGKSNEETT